MKPLLTSSAFAVLALITAACSGGPFLLEMREQVATLMYVYPPAPDDPDMNLGPDIRISVSGRTVDLTIGTYGPAGCVAPGGFFAEMEGMEVVLSPYNLHAPPDRDCVRLIETIHHHRTIEFPEDGLASIRVRGLRFDHTGWESVEIERRIEIQGGESGDGGAS
jgi:hypothetical protein